MAGCPPTRISKLPAWVNWQIIRSDSRGAPTIAGLRLATPQDKCDRPPSRRALVAELPNGKDCDPDHSNNQCGNESLSQEFLGDLLPPGTGGDNEERQT